jgi:hypothetical protein
MIEEEEGMEEGTTVVVMMIDVAGVVEAVDMETETEEEIGEGIGAETKAGVEAVGWTGDYPLF